MLDYGAIQRCPSIILNFDFNLLNINWELKIWKVTVKLLVSEYAANGCLFDYLTNNQLNFGQILRWSTDIAVGKFRLHVTDILQCCRFTHKTCMFLNRELLLCDSDKVEFAFPVWSPAVLMLEQSVRPPVILLSDHPKWEDSVVQLKRNNPQGSLSRRGAATSTLWERIHHV